MKSIKVKNEIIQDAQNIFDGAYSPLDGFLRKADYKSVLESMRLASGEVWSIPIVAPIEDETREDLAEEKTVKLFDNSGSHAALNNIEIYPYDKNEFCERVYGTVDINHPGVAEAMAWGDYLLGGEVVEVNSRKRVFAEHYFTPEETRRMFKDRGWRTVAAFQTRNVPHLGHEFLQRQALNHADGLFIQPVVGRKKPGDFKDEQILSSYRILIENFFPADKVVLGILPLNMRYAGPREAVMHALIRKNYGCSHFIIGRDHAGVGDYYAPTAAQEIFNKFTPEEIGIEILIFPEVVYCKTCGEHRFNTSLTHPPRQSRGPLPRGDFGTIKNALKNSPLERGGPALAGAGCVPRSEGNASGLPRRFAPRNDSGVEISGNQNFKVNEGLNSKSPLLTKEGDRGRLNSIDSCSHDDIIRFSGTRLRDYIKNKQAPPAYLIRPEVYEFLINSDNPLIDDMPKKSNNKDGFVLWFTGLSAAGKTTIADKVYEILQNNGARLERLDGDVVRERLTKGLGFDRDGRNENIRRIGFVANLLSRNGVGVLASFIAPYKELRDELRQELYNYIEVFVDAPLAVCEERDPKGMYKKARAGEIKLFTGIDDPYDKPVNPDIHLKTHESTADECADKVVEYLKEKGLVEI